MNACVIGLDLSLTSTGYAAPDGTTGRIRTKHTGELRLAYVRDAVLDLTAAWLPDLVVLEGYSYNSRSSQSHSTGELGGVVRLALHEAEVPVCVVAPTSLKKYATGKGNAGKDEVLVAAVRRLGYAGSSNDEADALWLRALGMDLLGRPVVELPKTHRDALAKVTLPPPAAAA